MGYKENELEKTTIARDSASKRLQNTSDSLTNAQKKLFALQNSIRDTILETYKNYSKMTNVALAKYNLQVLDSLRTVRAYKNPPQIRFIPESKDTKVAFLTQENGVDYINVKIESANNIAYFVRIDMCFFHYTGSFRDLNVKGIEFWGCQKNAVYRQFITPGPNTTAKVEVIPGVISVHNIIILLTGTFSADNQIDQKIPFHQALLFDFAENKADGVIAEELLPLLENLIK